MKEALLTEGFKPFEQRCLGHESAIANYQKCYRDEGGKRYYLTVFEYDHYRISGYPRNGAAPQFSFQFEAQFHDHDREGRVVDINTSTSDPAELPAILTMFRSAWELFGSIYAEAY